jgi:hypothetical protein
MQPMFLSLLCTFYEYIEILKIKCSIFLIEATCGDNAMAMKARFAYKQKNIDKRQILFACQQLFVVVRTTKSFFRPRQLRNAKDVI